MSSNLTAGSPSGILDICSKNTPLSLPLMLMAMTAFGVSSFETDLVAGLKCGDIASLSLQSPEIARYMKPMGYSPETKDAVGLLFALVMVKHCLPETMK